MDIKHTKQVTRKQSQIPKNGNGQTANHAPFEYIESFQAFRNHKSRS